MNNPKRTYNISLHKVGKRVSTEVKKMEITQMSITRRMDKQKVIYLQWTIIQP